MLLLPSQNFLHRFRFAPAKSHNLRIDPCFIKRIQGTNVIVGTIRTRPQNQHEAIGVEIKLVAKILCSLLVGRGFLIKGWIEHEAPEPVPVIVKAKS